MACFYVLNFKASIFLHAEDEGWRMEDGKYLPSFFLTTAALR